MTNNNSSQVGPQQQHNHDPLFEGTCETVEHKGSGEILQNKLQLILVML